jgi:hypothetical protein
MIYVKFNDPFNFDNKRQRFIFRLVLLCLVILGVLLFNYGNWGEFVFALIVFFWAPFGIDVLKYLKV